MPAKGPIARFVHVVGRTLKTSLAVVGVVTLGAGYYEYKALSPALDDSTKTLFTQTKKKEEEEKERKKKVLVIPFNRLDVVDRRKSSFKSSLSELGDKHDKIQTVELRELVDLIHTAAADPEITALYGIFGHSSALIKAGWADLEEIRNALRVFRESHRRHTEPNFQYGTVLVPRVDRKPMYAYSDTFAGLGDPGNKDYYLASVFTHIHMQKNGELNLFGMVSQQFFLRGLLEKYGINVHVFKHGKYKNAPNRLTERKLNEAHRENVTNIVSQLNADVCDEIQASRSKPLLTSWLRKSGDNIWKRIQEDAGTFPAHTAWKSGLIDFIPRRSPLFDLVEANLEKSKKEELKSVWNHHETDFDRFNASEEIEFNEYRKQVATKKKAEARMQSWLELATKFPEAGKVLTSIGLMSMVADLKPRSKIALLHVDSGIDDRTALKVVNAVRKICKDKLTKCLVVRVTSPGGTIEACETISQELKALKIPVIVSFGNVSASGGYYIASPAGRIFASRKTVTGSIGVFGIRPELGDFLGRYGINVEHVSVGQYSAMLSPFHPMTRKMKENFSQSIDRYYKQFKGVVAEGRGLPMEEVEDVAQGRVWTGDQAKGNGLVDEIGGLYRALAYAKRVYIKGYADVVVWPKEETLFEKLAAAIETQSLAGIISVLREWLAIEEPNQRTHEITTDLMAKQLVRMVQNPSTSGKFMGGIMMAADENTAISLLLKDCGVEESLLPDDFWR